MKFKNKTIKLQGKQFQVCNHSVMSGREERFRTSRNDNMGNNKSSVIPACRPDASGFFKTYYTTRN